MYFDNARYYDPATSKFISIDPAGFAGGSANLYGYVNADPVNFTDPSGLSPKSGQILSAAAFLVAGALAPELIPAFLVGMAYYNGAAVGLNDVANGHGLAHSLFHGVLAGPGFASFFEGYTDHDVFWNKLNQTPAQKGAKIIGGLMELGGLAFGVYSGMTGSAGELGELGGPRWGETNGDYGSLAPPVKGGAEDAGTTVIGHYPDYVNLAQDLKANYFNIPTEQWNAMTEAERWAANQEFLDEAIARGDNFRLATPIDKVRPGSYLEKEIQHLTSRGYRLNDDGSALVPPTWR